MYYNPLDKFYKNTIGAICAQKEITFRVKGDFKSVVFVCKKDGENYNYYAMNKSSDFFEISLFLDVGLYFYHFECDGRVLSNGYEYVGCFLDSINDFQLTVHSKDYQVPNWLYGGIIYQIFPDRFYRHDLNKIVPKNKILHQDWNDIPVFLPNEKGEIINNDFFGGDLKGIIEKLDYIKSLGVNAIYLNPIFKAFSNHRYDTGNYMEIDELLGKNEDLLCLIKTAKEKDIKIILDGVFNHTGDDSLYFNKYGNYDSVGAYQDINSKYYNWYNFKQFPNDYDSWWGIKTLPAINENNSEYIDFITGQDGVIEYYTKLGISGWRLDVVDELPSEFVKNIRNAVKRNNDDAIIIGEVWEDASNKVSYGKRREYLQGKELDSVMNYPLKNAIINFVLSGDSALLYHIIAEQIDHYPHKVLHSLMNILSTHDTARILTVVGGESPNGKTKTELSTLKISQEKFEVAKFNLKVATLLQFTLCGVPSIYYGDEVGMQGYGDPLNRCTYPWGNEDIEIFDWYSFLSNLRKKYSAFSQGNFEKIYIDDGVFVFKRYDEKSEVLICINISEKDIIFDYDGSLTDLLTKKTYKNSYILKEKTLGILINKIKE